jgi:UDP-N-acetylmuramate--alanine ligase
LQATRQRYPSTTIWAVWQPHTYSRTRLLAKDFVAAFHDANYALFMDIYAAREQAQPDDPTGDKLAQMTQRAGHGDVRYSGGIEATADSLSSLVRRGDVVIIFSAGDAPRVGEILLENLSRLENH